MDTKLRHSYDAIAPVIGVVLLFAISIILAAGTGSLVVGGGESFITTAPTASFDFNFEAGATESPDLTDSGDAGVLTITHVGGDTMDASNMNIRAQPGGIAGERRLDWSGDIAAGSSTTVTVDAEATVRLVHSTDGGSTTVAAWSGGDK